MKGVYCEQLCENVSVTDNFIEHIADDGIDFEGLFCGAGDVNNHNTIWDNKIEHVGELAGGSEAIRLANSGHNTVMTEQSGHYGPRNFIYITDIETPGLNDGYAWGNVIQYNKAIAFYQDSNDGGAFGVFALGNEPPTNGPPWRTNYFLQNVADHIVADPRMLGPVPVCMFTDNQSHGQTVGDFLCTNSTSQERVNDSGSLTENNGTTDHLVWDVSWGTSGGGAVDLPNVGLTGANPY